MFSPNLEDRQNLVAVGNDRLLRFNSIIELDDVQGCSLLSLPTEATLLGRRLGIELRLRGIGSRIRSLSARNREELRRLGAADNGVAYIHLFIYEFAGEKEA